ncbi:Hypothetical predicted protein [Pelobates cultripes]|uniref:Uncharacterized protein n=1 Tax=Pelobates cultripes TaxID=61616 RepID=A0AAD1R8C3_PELCU|nr:Hypothetical predicted protein [Pelobates cultripes]
MSHKPLNLQTHHLLFPSSPSYLSFIFFLACAPHPPTPQVPPSLSQIPRPPSTHLRPSPTASWVKTKGGWPLLVHPFKPIESANTTPTTTPTTHQHHKTQ